MSDGTGLNQLESTQVLRVQEALDRTMRKDKGRLLAGLISRLGDFSTAEDALQEALLLAIRSWRDSGIPRSPAAWLMTVAVNKGIDRYRANSADRKKNVGLQHMVDFDRSLAESFEGKLDIDDIEDDRLRLIFTCCHPALEEKSRVALTLRTVCNLTTREISAAFLDNESTMAQRISRAKSKIRQKGIRYRVPDASMWQDRLGTVLSTIYLIFTTGYLNDRVEPRELCHEGLFLATLLLQLRPDDPETMGALALMHFTQARSRARISTAGASVPIEEQSRECWDHEAIVEAQRLLELAMQARMPGPFQIKAAIADCHMSESGPDWQQISLLYQSLWRFEPTPVVALNWAVVMAEVGNITLADEKIAALEKDLKDFQPWYAARAKVLAMTGMKSQAVDAYSAAIARTTHAASRTFLEAKRFEVLQQLAHAVQDRKT